jgi:hypothetical protein
MNCLLHSRLLPALLVSATEFVAIVAFFVGSSGRRREEVAVSCEAQERAVESARAAVEGQRAECDALEIEKGPNDPDAITCRARQRQFEANLRDAEHGLQGCREAAEAKVLRQAEGVVVFLRVHEPGGGYGGGESNFINADVVFKLEPLPDKAFGFQLRNDAFLPVREGMLSLLREAIAHDLRVRVDYDELVQAPNQNSFATRIALVRPSRTLPKAPPRRRRARATD